VAQYYVTGRIWFEKAAAGGGATAMFNVGLLYEIGRGMVQDYAVAQLV
jgi:TPR repeat protein